tara:strand:+ start:211 stop:918 length:708 start_codon:yes stop_codon:yes gene_type:complete
MAIVCCHQPDFFPWLGFFSKLKKSEIWVMLDHVKNNPKDPQNWIRRVKIRKGEEQQWVSLPVDKKKSNHGHGIPISQWRYETESPNWSIQKTKIIEEYSQHKYYPRVEGILEEFFDSKSDNLSEKNLNLIERLIEYLGIDVKVVRSSSLDLETSSNEMLVEAVLKVGGNIYLSGDGADGYMNNDLFYQKGLEVTYNKYNDAVHKQDLMGRQFIPGLSALDAICSFKPEDIEKRLY